MAEEISDIGLKGENKMTSKAIKNNIKRYLSTENISLKYLSKCTHINILILTYLLYCPFSKIKLSTALKLCHAMNLKLSMLLI